MLSSAAERIDQNSSRSGNGGGMTPGQLVHAVWAGAAFVDVLFRPVASAPAEKAAEKAAEAVAVGRTAKERRAPRP